VEYDDGKVSEKDAVPEDGSDVEYDDGKMSDEEAM
jgi:hypothetical protein